MFDLALNTGARYPSRLLPAVGMAAALLAGPSCAPEPAEAPGWARTALLDSRVRELESRRHPAREAIVRIPALASGAVELHDRDSAVSVAVALAGAGPVAGTRSGPFVYYPAALASGADYLLLERPDGFEDFVLYHEPPPEETARFSLDVTGVPGLRLVGGVLELLDESGTPRLRARPPYLVDARGARIDATVALEGCDADRDPRAPWGRPVVAPGAERCTLTIRWGATFGQAVSYPAVLDPWMPTRPWRAAIIAPTPARAARASAPAASPPATTAPAWAAATASSTQAKGATTPTWSRPTAAPATASP